MLALARTILYSVVIFASFFSFVLSAAFIGRTNSDFESYNEGSAAVLAASLLILLSLPVLHFLFHRRGSTSIVGSLAVELALVSVLWVIMLGGAAAMSDQMRGLGGCTASLCSLARAVQAFAWIAWISLSLLLALVVTLAVVSARAKSTDSVWTRPLDVDRSLARDDGSKSTSRPSPGGPAPVGQSGPPVMSSA
ncbi:hypothetical protein JCM11491_001917 [Sporobolomyces phaffii]